LNLQNKIILLIVNVLLFTGLNSSQVMIPSCMLDYNQGRENYILIVDKSTQSLYVYTTHHPKPVKTYKITTGKNRGIKIFEGDKKTPEGIYLFKRVIAKEDLPRTDDYGVQAFTLNYPNPVDKQSQRNGSGIWLHGANEANKINTPFNTRGCVVMSNSDLIDVSKYIFLNQTILCIYDKIIYESSRVLQTKRQQVLKKLQAWKKSWENKDINAYINFYSPDFSQKGMGLSAYKRYKKRLNNKYKFISVILSNIHLYGFEDYWVSMFDQLYISDFNQFNSKKIQYWRNSSEGARIIDSNNYSLPQVQRFRDSSGNYISIQEHRKNLLHKLKSDLKLFSAPQLMLQNISRIDSQVAIECRATCTNDEFSMIPVLRISKGGEKNFMTIPGIILKDGIPQSFENSLLINRKYIESSIVVQKGWKVEGLTLFILDPDNSFVQINRFYIDR
jgi:murein L,D-transpeptidase YafK